MRRFSAMLRLLTGVIILAMSGRVLMNNSAQIRSNAATIIDLYGQRFRVDGHTLLGIVLGMAVIGLALLVYGMMGIIRRRPHASAPPNSPHR